MFWRVGSTAGRKAVDFFPPADAVGIKIGHQCAGFFFIRDWGLYVDRVNGPKTFAFLAVGRRLKKERKARAQSHFRSSLCIFTNWIFGNMFSKMGWGMEFFFCIFFSSLTDDLIECDSYLYMVLSFCWELGDWQRAGQLGRAEYEGGRKWLGRERYLRSPTTNLDLVSAIRVKNQFRSTKCLIFAAKRSNQFFFGLDVDRKTRKRKDEKTLGKMNQKITEKLFWKKKKR